MPPGGTLFRFFERFGENVPRSREASMPPLQQKRNVFGNRQTPICRFADKHIHNYGLEEFCYVQGNENPDREEVLQDR